MAKILKIIRDEYANNPREEFDHLGKMVCFHNRYNLGDKHNFRDPEDFMDFLKCNPSFVLELYLYDHSGITMSSSPFSCPWDSGQVGWIYVTKESVRREWQTKRISPQLKKIIMKNLQCEVDEYDAYISGEVYGFRLVNEEIDQEEDELDSCWGFFGSDPNNNGMNEYVDMKQVDEIRYV